MSLLKVENVSVRIPIFEIQDRSLLKKFTHIGKSSRLNNKENRFVVVEALTDINFSLSTGDRLGLIGQNGSGKSTLLRVLAGIYSPQKGGKLIRSGKVVPILDLSLGLDDSLTGRQNIRLKAMFLGLLPSEIKEQEEAIIEFSELDEFIDMPIRTYSSGMRIRLAFSIAMFVKADILLLDEVMGVGDIAFQDKANQKLQNLTDNVGIVVMAIHSNEAITKMCNKVMWLEGGKVKMFGQAKEVTDAYIKFMHNK